jgi:23S rRNA pseudouridine2605 synthase
MKSASKPVRLQKVLAEAGVASRRASEQIILNGRVTVNGQRVSKLGACVNPAMDKICVDGRVLQPPAKVYLAFHKPRGCVCTRQDEENRPTIMDLLPRELASLYPVGRLDFNSEGLIFLTNDGEFSLRLTHPRYGVVKKYLATLSGPVTADMLAQITRGVFHEGERMRAEKATLVSTRDNRSVVELELGEGKNREVRRMFETFGLFVRKLVRTQIGTVRLGNLKAGQSRPLTEAEIRSLLSNL